MAVVDGLDVLREQMSLHEIMRLIEGSARWVSRETFDYLPIWFPEEARRDLMYKGNWGDAQHNTNKTTKEKVHKRVGNTNANLALTWALGLRAAERPNWTCCHIWSVDDPAFRRPNAIAGDKRFYSCVANMVLLPTPLKAFTDAMPEVKTMLRIASTCYYGWAPLHSDVPMIDDVRGRCVWEAYPASWPTEIGEKTPRGVAPIDAAIRLVADRRLGRVLSDIRTAGDYYPRDEVRGVLRYWSEQLPDFGERLENLGLGSLAK